MQRNNISPPQSPPYELKEKVMEMYRMKNLVGGSFKNQFVCIHNKIQNKLIGG